MHKILNLDLHLFDSMIENQKNFYSIQKIFNYGLECCRSLFYFVLYKH